MSALAPTMQGFFTERLLTQRRASTNTVASYRDTFRLLLGFAQRRTGKTPSNLQLEDLDAVLIGAFLDHLEVERHNSARTRNTRLAAVHSLFAYAALRHPEHAAVIQRVLAIPAKRTDRQLVSFLTRHEVDALLAAPDRSTWVGRRDHALLLVAVQTGLRVTELTALTCQDVELGAGAHLRCHGKGRKERITPLTKVRPDGRLLVIEQLIPPGNEPALSKLYDVHMLVLSGGRERTEDEYRELLEMADFRLTRVVPTDMPRSIIEALPT